MEIIALGKPASIKIFSRAIRDERPFPDPAANHSRLALAVNPG